MIKNLLNLKQTNNIKQLYSAITLRKSIDIRGLSKGERCFLLCLVNSKILYVASSEENAKSIKSNFESLGKKCSLVLHRRNLVYSEGEDEFAKNILASLADINSDCDILIVTPEVLLEKFPNVELYKENELVLECGQEVDLKALIKHLDKVGYERTQMVEKVGQFSLRGDILDIYPITSKDSLPVRIELFGDEIEKIKHFNIQTYQSVDSVESVKICPASFILDDFESVSAAMQGEKTNELVKEKLNFLSEAVLSYNCTNLAYATAFSSNTTQLFEYFKDGCVVFDEPVRVKDLLNESYNDFVLSLSADDFCKRHLTTFFKSDEVVVKDDFSISFAALAGKNPFVNVSNVLNFTIALTSKYFMNFAQLKQDLLSFRGKTIVLCCGNATQANDLFQTLANNSVLSNLIAGKDIKQGEINVTTFAIELSACLPEEDIIIIGYNDLFNKKQTKQVSKQNVFYLPKVGDFVVHENHGVGKCLGIKKINFGFSERDYIVVEYNGGDMLYVPTEQVDLLSQFVSGEKAPKLNNLGSDAFTKAKERVRSSVKEMVIDLLDLYASRENAKGYVYSDDNYLTSEFENSFAYDLTADQEQAVNDIKKDMTSGKIMDRLVCGDVGYGKTEVALRAAYKTIVEGKQVAFLAPTTILSMQHYNTVFNRMNSFGVVCACMNRFNTESENSEIAKKLIEGKINIVCGTHRLLSKDVGFDDLGLLILDEEQRFGVEDKEKIKSLKKNINVLTLSATPIPRTLHMSLTGIRDISLITTPPKDRLPVQTVVCELNDSVIVSAVKRELDRQGQVLIVYNRVETINKFASKVRALLPDGVEVSVAHGQMSEKALEDEVLKLYNGKTQVLVATTLIENGVDLPNANTLIVIDADRLGLSQLYQLRGRVGRSSRLAYAYFTYDGEKPLSDSAYKRLGAMSEFTELGSGFKIAMRDLEIRGAGNVLGAEQHGHIEKIGYDLYCKLLSEQVSIMKGEKAEAAKDVKVDVSFDAFLPREYIEDDSERIKVYSMISKISSEEMLNDTHSRICDIYGKAPKSVEGLESVALMKNLAQKVFAKRVVLNNHETFIEFYEESPLLTDSGSEVLNKYRFVSVLKFEKLPKLVFNKEFTIQKKQSLIIEFLNSLAQTKK